MQKKFSRPTGHIRIIWVSAIIIAITTSVVFVWRYTTTAADDVTTYVYSVEGDTNSGYANDDCTNEYNPNMYHSDEYDTCGYYNREYDDNGYDADEYYVEEPRVVLSPSNLQLSMFAHMAFFPFDFNAGGFPQSHNFDSLHYEPFLKQVMTADIWTQNPFGFSFAEEMSGWYLVRVYTDYETGFSAVIYSCAYRDALILAIRGSDGNLGEALLTQTGTWWCNFRSIGGYRHSHKDSLVDFLNMPDMAEKLQAANIYITGHSLGGYLAYIATYEMVQMGLEDNIRRVVAFSAPIFTAHTLDMVSALSPDIRSRMSHFYVPEDLIAGFVGIDMGIAFPGYGAFGLVTQLIRSLRDVRNIDVPPAVYAFSSLMAIAEPLLPFEVPGHIAEILWRLNGVVGDDAMALTNEFRALITHVQVAQTWHSERPDPAWNLDTPLWDILLNYTHELVIEIVIEMVLLIFDVDSHFMMNFYYYFS